MKGRQADRRDGNPAASALLLRIREAATLLAVSERQVWVLLRAGQLTAIHPPGIRAVRIARADVERLVEKWCAGADVR
jgi:excisionase family DNA binding protein